MLNIILAIVSAILIALVVIVYVIVVFLCMHWSKPIIYSPEYVLMPVWFRWTLAAATSILWPLVMFVVWAIKRVKTLTA